MTNSKSPSPERLDEIRKLAIIAHAEDRAAETIKARKRRVFGPLFYSTLVVGAIVTTYVVWLRVAELFEQMTRQPGELSARSDLAASVKRLEDNNWEARAAAARATRAALLRYGPGNNLEGVREEALRALLVALLDQAGPVRADAADALGSSQQFARLARSELTRALTDEDPTVRLAAARALLQTKDESTVAALRALSDLLTDPTPASDRKTVISVMRSEGSAGVDSAVKSVATMLTSRDELLRSAGLDCITALENDARRLVSALEPLLSASDNDVRSAAALAAARVTDEGEKSAPGLCSILEAAVIDPALAANIREDAVQELTRLSRTSLGRCGRELARQINHPSYNVRLEAATILHMIDPATLADQGIPSAGP